MRIDILRTLVIGRETILVSTTSTTVLMMIDETHGEPSIVRTETGGKVIPVGTSVGTQNHGKTNRSDEMIPLKTVLGSLLPAGKPQIEAKCKFTEVSLFSVAAVAHTRDLQNLAKRDSLRPSKNNIGDKMKTVI